MILAVLLALASADPGRMGPVGPQGPPADAPDGRDPGQSLPLPDRRERVRTDPNAVAKRQWVRQMERCAGNNRKSVSCGLLPAGN